jgi:hypothetical protein
MRNQGNFVPMTGPVRTVFEALAELVDCECGHECKHKGDCTEVRCGHVTQDNGDVVCTKVTLTGIEEAAVRIADMIDKGELS